MKKIIVLVLCAAILLIAACYTTTDDKSYGVFLSLESDLNSINTYDTVVIDAQYFSAEEIKRFKNQDHKVLSYINIGSLESFRDYYDSYSDLALCPYEHWDEEAWIDVSSSRWQSFVVDELITSLAGKGIDGFFVDNCDVYYVNPTPEIMDGLTVMLRSMMDTGLDVIINGGDCYLDAYCASGGSWNDVITGINQESVFSSILWDSDSFGTANEEDHEYYCDYIERYSELGADIYLLEYTTDKKLISEIDSYCKRNGFDYYIADSIELGVLNTALL